MPNQVYMLDPETQAVKVVADQFDKNNGIAFSGDGKTAYVYVDSCLTSASMDVLS